MSPSVIEAIVLDRKENKDEPLYQQIRRQLGDKINTGEALPGERFPSIASLAKKWNVSYQTIRTAFELLVEDGLVTYQSNKCVLVSDRPGSSTPKSTKRLTVSYITCHHDDPYYAIMAGGIRRFAIEHDWRYMMLDVGNDRDAFIEAVGNPGRDCLGLLVLPFEVPGYEKTLQRVIDAGVQTVFVDRVLPGMKVSSVESDHFSVAYQATTHLLETHNLILSLASGIFTFSKRFTRCDVTRSSSPICRTTSPRCGAGSMRQRANASSSYSWAIWHSAQSRSREF